MADHAAADRGREADRPQQIPSSGWKDIAWRVKDEASSDNLSMIAGGVAFYTLLALPASLAAIVSLYGLIASPETVSQQIGAIADFVPGQAADLLHEQLTRVTQQSGGTLGLSLVISLGVALWSAAKGMKALMTALNIAYNEEEKRGFLKLNAVALALTLGGIIYLIAALTIVAAIPVLLEALPLPGWLRWTVQLARWPILLVLAMLALAVVYRYAPSRDEPKWRWVSAGAILGTALWLLGSIAFSLYVTNFDSYNKTYGSLGAVVILMMWLYISAYSVLLGAELNSEMERQTERDTTKGPEQPMGRRSAYSADTVGEPKG